MFLTLALALAAPVPKDDPVLYFPTAVGAVCVYVEQPRVGDKEFVSAVTGVGDGRNGKLVTVARSSGSTSFWSHRYEASGSGLSVVAQADGKGGEFVPVPPDVLLKLPVRPGQRWEGKTVDGDKYVRTTRGVERVRVPAGEFEAVRVDWELSGPHLGVVSVSSWYAPGVGLVKEDRSRDAPPGGRGVTMGLRLTAVRQGAYGK